MEVSHINIVIFSVTERRLELLIINVYHFCLLNYVTYISLPLRWETGVTMN